MLEASLSDQIVEILHPKTVAASKRHSRALPFDLMLLSKPDVARVLGVSGQSIDRWTRAGYLTALKLGNGSVRAPRRYRASDIAAFIESRLNSIVE